MPTIPELPPASTTGAQDELPVSQEGITRSVTVSELLSGTQPAIELPSGDLLGRVSLGPGGPEAVQVGLGLVVGGGVIAANGGDHASFAAETALNLTDDAILNSSGTPARLRLPLLRGLFTAGTNIAINPVGAISAATDPTVSSELTSLTTGLATTNATVAALGRPDPAGRVRHAECAGADYRARRGAGHARHGHRGARRSRADAWREGARYCQCPGFWCADQRQRLHRGIQRSLQCHSCRRRRSFHSGGPTTGC
ncbi:MAG: hypothetical protein WDN04_16825 [Rhodospirillales bacterium]